MRPYFILKRQQEARVIEEKGRGQMQALVKLIEDEPFTDSVVIAAGTKSHHESIQRRIRDYKQELSTFGKVGFEIRPMDSGQEMKVYLLNEQQATFLITLLKNTKIVVAFKLELVRQFYEMRERIKKGRVPPTERPGEVANLIKILSDRMDKQGSEPYRSVEMAQMLCEQYGIQLPEDIVKIPGYEQMRLPLMGGSVDA